MKYMITFNHVDGAWDALSESEQQRHGVWLREFVKELESEKQAKLVFLNPMSPPKTVRQYEDGRIEVLDGPAQPSPEQPGGFYIIDADSMDEAVEWARKGRFMQGSNEVREIVAFEP